MRVFNLCAFVHMSVRCACVLSVCLCACVCMCPCACVCLCARVGGGVARILYRDSARGEEEAAEFLER